MMKFCRTARIFENSERPKTKRLCPSSTPPTLAGLSMKRAPICQILSQFSLPSAVVSIDISDFFSIHLASDLFILFFPLLQM